MSGPLSFGSAGSPFDDTKLTGFDATGPDLSGFDADAGPLIAPAGGYVVRAERGELTHTKAGKLAYRLCVKIVDGEHVGLTIWKWYLLDDLAKKRAAAVALKPLGITAQTIHSPFPPVGADVYVRALVTIRPAKNGYPESNDIERFEPCPAPAGATAPPNPFAVPLDAPTSNTGEGVKQ